jgi:hypothetical protein
MAYDKKKIFEQAKEVIRKHKLFFIEDIVAFLPINKSTFYVFFKIGSEELKTLNYLLSKNKISETAINRVPEYIHNNKEGYIYLVHCENTNYYKIGISNSQYKNRLSTLQSGCPIKLHMIHVAHSLDYKNIEKKLHSKYRNNAHFGEWFIFEKNEIKNVIKSMNEMVKKQLLIDFQ